MDETTRDADTKRGYMPHGKEEESHLEGDPTNSATQSNASTSPQPEEVNRDGSTMVEATGPSVTATCDASILVEVESSDPGTGDEGTTADRVGGIVKTAGGLENSGDTAMATMCIRYYESTKELQGTYQKENCRAGSTHSNRQDPRDHHLQKHQES